MTTLTDVAPPLRALSALVLSMSAALPLLRVFGSPGLRLIILSTPFAVLAATIVKSGLSRLFDGRRPLLASIFGFVAGLAVGAVPGLLTASADQFGPGALGARLVSAVRDGWLRILSVPVPVPGTRSFTDLPVLLTAALAALITVIALADWPVIALAPATLGFGGLLVLGVQGPGSPLLITASYALAALVFLMAIGSPGARRPLAAAASAAAIMVTAALVAVTWQPAHPYDPRTALPVPVRPVVTQDPLALLPARLETPGVVVFTARLSGALLTHPRNWVVLAYEDYDRAAWLPTGSADPVADGGPAPSAVGAGTAVVSLGVPTTLLPHPSYVRKTLPADFAYGSAPEMLAAPRRLRRYTVEVSVAQPSVKALTFATVPTGTQALLTEVPACVPDAIRQLATQARQQASLPPEQAIRLEQLLKYGQFRYDQAAPPGEGCGSLGHLFSTYRGTSAQFATAFALAARLLGLPTRVAVGYLPGHLTGDTDTVTDADAYAWPQVLMTGVGWVDFDPTPKAGTSSASPAREKQPALTKVKVQKPSHAARNVGPKIIPPRISTRPHAGLAVWIALGAFVLIVLVLILLAVWSVRPRLRRIRRRRSAEPAARALGAWYEVLPPLERVGVPIQGRSASNIAATATGLVSDDARALSRLAVLAERALYDEVADQDATIAWQLSDHARATIAAASRSARTGHAAANARWRR